MVFSKELKKGSTELLVLSLLEQRPRHGYEIGKLIELRSGGTLRFRISALYPILFRLEQRQLIGGRWVERPNERRRRFYRLTAAGRRTLGEQRKTWRAFTSAVDAVVGLSGA